MIDYSLGTEFNIPNEIKLKQNDLIDENKKLFNLSFSGSLIPKEFYLTEFKENSEIYKFGINILKNIDNTKYNLLYVPDKEWYNIFRITTYNYNLI